MTALNMLEEFKDIVETTLQYIKYGCYRETILPADLKIGPSLGLETNKWDLQGNRGAL